MQGGAGQNDQAIIVMVRVNHECCCCTLKLDVPANFTVLEENCGASEPLMRPGAHWCYTCNRRVAAMLTKNIVNYDAPIKRCPTKDNAYVDIDIHFTFRMPQVEQEVKKFVYCLGAGRFDELLAAETDEAMRSFINTIWLSQVFDLKSDMALAMVGDLNRKFAQYGIRFEGCQVLNVHVNPGLLQALQEKTQLKFKLKNHEKDQDLKVQNLRNEEYQKLTALKRENERKLFELHQQIQRAAVDKEQDELQA